MRKHFLILMLMTLLPFTAWAVDDDITDVTVSIGVETSANYDGTNKLPDVTVQGKIGGAAAADLTEGTHYTATWSKEGVDVQTGVNAGTYTLTVAKLPTYGGSFTVKEGESLTKTFVVNQISASATVTANDLRWTNAAQELVAASNVVGGVVKFSTTADGDFTTTVPKGTAVQEYTIYYKVFSNNENYKNSDAILVPEVQIKQKLFNSTNLTVTLSGNSKKYTGRAQYPTVTVTDNALETNLAATDYEVTYEGVTDHTETTPVTVQEYKVTVTGTGAGNYTNASFDAAANHAITKATLYIKVNDVSKTYDGEEYNPVAAPTGDGVFTFTATGLKNGETLAQALDNTAITVSGYAGNVNYKAGGYQTLTISNAAALTTASKNYTVEASSTNGILTINKKALTFAFPANFTPNVNQKVYGAADPTFNATWITNNITLTGVENNETASIKGELKVTRTGVGTTDGESVGTKTGVLVLGYKTTTGDNPHPTLDNYSFDFTLAANKGNFKITKKVLTIGLAEPLEVTYTGVQAVLPSITYQNLYVEGLMHDDTAESIIGTNVPVLSVGEAINQGYYDVTLAPATGFAPADYDVEFDTGELHIKPATVTVNFTTQTLTAGGTIADELNPTLFTVNGMQNNESDQAIFYVDIDDASKDGTDNTKVAATAATGEHLVLKVKTGKEAAAANYIGYATATGTLVIAGTGTYVLSDNADVEIAAADITGNPVDVTFSSSRSLKPQQWYAMVLPFEVSVAKLSRAFDYAIVNRLNTTNTTADHVAFGLEMQKIPANEPFLIKIVGVEGAGNTYTARSLNNVTIPQVVLVEAEETSVGSATTNLFTGNYTFEKPLTGNKIGFLSKGGWVCPFELTKKMQPLDAYLQYSIERTPTSQAPLITVEDENGATAIMTIAADGRMIEAEGWYTVNGVKLQGAPTEKGIYIRNGKKVVVK